MLALRIQNHNLSVQKVSEPSENGEAVVRVLKSGICGTDLELLKGYSDFQGTPGHEFVGVVESAEDRPELVGKRVVGEINAGCGKCEPCKTGDQRHCPHRTVLGIVGRDGAHAEFLRLPSQNLYVVPEEVSDEEAVFVEPLAAAVGITERVKIETSDRVAVIGDGKLGILCARALAITTRAQTLVLFGKYDQKLDLVRRSGIETQNIVGIAEPSLRFDVVVEASGSESGFSKALELVKPRGIIVLKSTYHGLARWDASRIVVNEINVIGSRCGRFAPALKLLASNQIQVADLISDEFPLSDGVAAFARAETKGVLKVLIRAS